MLDPAVRAIRVAVTLNDRFAELMNPRRSAASRLISPHGTIEQLELRISEAQQIYPEIWRHLDEARAALASRDVDVAAYDQLRSKPQTRMPGVTEVDTDTKLGGVPLIAVTYEKTKSASFNAGGHALARAAYDALMRAMPDVDWRALAQAEQAEFAAIGPLRPRIRAVSVLIGLSLSIAVAAGLALAL